MTTPSQRAKEFATQHGFKITPNGRRYDVEHGNELVANVGGYEAALNAMKARLESGLQVSQDAAFNNPRDAAMMPAIPDECAASGASCSYRPHGINGESQCQYCGKPKPMPWSDQRTAEMIAQGDAVTNKSLRLAGLLHRAGFTAADVATRNKLVYGDERGMKGVDFPFEASGTVTVNDQPVRFKIEGTQVTASPGFLDFDGAAKARIHKLARRLTRERRRAAGKPPGGPWHVIFDGKTVMRYGYPSRAEAIAVVRWGFNHVEPHIRNNWRITPVTVEYRP
jgi:hypothetical protein